MYGYDRVCVLASCSEVGVTIWLIVKLSNVFYIKLELFSHEYNIVSSIVGN